MRDLSYVAEWRDGEHPGYYVTLDEVVTEDAQWHGPFENAQVAEDFVLSFIEEALITLSTQSLNL